MNEEAVHAAVEAALNPEEFDVLDYVNNLPVATNTVKIYTNVGGARELAELLTKRQAILDKRDAEAKADGYSDLSIADNDRDTELDDEINELLEKLDETALTFHLKSVAPKLIRAIQTAAIAKADKNWTEEQQANHNTRTTGEILAKAIDHVVLANGAVDNKPWDAERLQGFEEAMYVEQSKQLVSALYQIVYTGEVFDEVLSVDF